jgi:hypothetical protein
MTTPPYSRKPGLAVSGQTNSSVPTLLGRRRPNQDSGSICLVLTRMSVKSQGVMEAVFLVTRLG